MILAITTVADTDATLVRLRDIVITDVSEEKTPITANAFAVIGGDSLTHATNIDIGDDVDHWLM